MDEKHNSTLQQADIAIVGAGITGMAIAYHLKQQVTKNIVVIGRRQSLSEHSAGIISGTPLDHYTRLCQAHGDSCAKKIWSFANTSYEALAKYLLQHQIPFHKAQRFRLVSTQHEQEEVNIAVQKLKAHFLKLNC